ncbi:MAG: hypothetical protein V4606_00210 [Patescibacteria group bacterium]
MIKETIAGVGVIATVSGLYGVQALYGAVVTPAPQIEAVDNGLVTSPLSKTSVSAQLYAQQFADTLGKLQNDFDRGALDQNVVVARRDQIGHSFAESYGLIQELEAAEQFEQAQIVRDILDIAIADYLESHARYVPSLSNDLHVYSKFLTETHIRNSIERQEL